MRRPALALALLVALTPGVALAAGGSNPAGGAAQAPVGNGGSTGDTAFGEASGPGGDPETGPDGVPVGDGGGSSGTITKPRIARQTIELPGPCPPLLDNSRPRLLQDQVRVLPDGAWRPVRTYCEGDPLPEPAPVIDPDVIRQTAASVRAQVRAPRPRLAVQPRAEALVRQPAIFSTVPPASLPSATDTDELSGLSVTVSLGAPTYDWSFGDGAGRTGLSSTGRPYAPGDAVPAEGSGSPLITHTYTGPGSRRVTVTAVYPVTFSYGTPAVTQQLPPVRATTAVVLPVRAARSELVAR